MKYTILVVFFVLLFIAPTIVNATLGVGVGKGKIKVEETLKPGTIYELPTLTVLNTGDVASKYEIAISYHQAQPELRPEEGWFTFSPKNFYLEPGGVQLVTMRLNVPIRSDPGNYFAYIEAHPIIESASGQTAVGIAAASKLYFSIIPGSEFEGILNMVFSFLKLYSPWPQVVLMVIIILVALFILKRFFNVSIDAKRREN